MNTTPIDPADGNPRNARGARETPPPGSAGRAAPVAPVAGAAHPTSPPAVAPSPPGPEETQPSPSPPAAVTGMPSPETGADGVGPSAPVRGRAPQAPAVGGGASPAPSAGLQAMAAAMSEDDLLVSVTCGTRKRPGLCKLYGLKWFHDHDSRRNPEGFPDLVIVGRKVMYRELKTQKGTVSPAQKEWLEALRIAGQDACVWRPVHLLNGTIAQELAALAGRRGAA